MKNNLLNKPPSILPVDSRRDFFKKALAGGVAASALGVLPINVPRVFGQSPTSDIDILNYALTLEHLEYAYYRDQLARFTARQFRSRYGSFDGMLKGISRRKLKENQAPQNSRARGERGRPTSSTSAAASGGNTEASTPPAPPSGSSRRVTVGGGSSQATANNGGSTSGTITSGNTFENSIFGNGTSGNGTSNGQNNNGQNNGNALTVYEFFTEIRDHEAAHVQTLTQTIQSLGGTPVQELEYDFGVDNLAEFVSLAQVLENTGVSAYDGAIALISSPELQTAGATIATVEARHAAFLNLLNGESPFPQAFDTPKSMAEVIAAVTPFIVS